jgi:O-succinylbenzoate synthase
MFASDVTADPLLPVGGRVPVRRATVSSDLLDRNAASPERTAWWLARLERVHTLLAAA